MGRPRKSTAELERNGSFEKHPERKRARAGEPKPQGPLGSPPARFLRTESAMAARQLEAWNELLTMVPPGVLTSAERWWCERAAVLMAESRYRTLKASEETALANYLTKMGCNPADRSKVNIVPGAPNVDRGDSSSNSNEFAALAEETACSRPN
ncbi:MAG: hypothetical protein WA708_18205 [Acidobacteriaceae bacterium]